jgi:hypothetical protein
MQILKHNTAYKQKQGQKPHDSLDRYRKSLWQNSTLCHDKSTEELGIEGMFLNIWQTS